MSELKRIYIIDDYVREIYRDALEDNIKKHSIPTYEIIESNDMRGLEELFLLYEFTDEICLIENNLQYPSILNYVRTGLLTGEEMIQAVLHR